MTKQTYEDEVAASAKNITQQAFRAGVDLELLLQKYYTVHKWALKRYASTATAVEEDVRNHPAFGQIRLSYALKHTKADDLSTIAHALLVDFNPDTWTEEALHGALREYAMFSFGGIERAFEATLDLKAKGFKMSGQGWLS